MNSNFKYIHPTVTAPSIIDFVKLKKDWRIFKTLTEVLVTLEHALHHEYILIGNNKKMFDNFS